MITQEELRERYDYHPDGYLTYRFTRGRAREGERVGSISQKGYIITKIRGKHLSVHQLIYIWHHGEIEYQIDHINNKRDDNRIENLRDITNIENQYNLSSTKRNGGLRRYTDENGNVILTELGREIKNREAREQTKNKTSFYHKLTEEEKREFAKRCNSYRDKKNNDR